MNRAGWLCAVIFLSLCLQACGGGSSSNPPTNPPPVAEDPKISIVSPADGSLISALPINISIKLSDGASFSGLHAFLNGVDVTSQFAAPDSTGVAQLTGVGQPALNLGKNQLQISNGNLYAQSSFSVNLGGSSTSAGLPLLIPIRTRVLRNGDGSHETDYNIELDTNPANPTYIAAPALPSNSIPNQGFHVVYLRRDDLSVVSNRSFPNPTPSTQNSWLGSPIGLVFSQNPPASCGNPTPGCFLIIQSFGTIGYAPCYQEENRVQDDCVFATVSTQQTGASSRWLYANGSNPEIAYSFIGNISGTGTGAPPPVPAGTYFERLTCSGSNTDTGNPCDNLGTPTTSQSAPASAAPNQIGNINGALVRDNFFNFTFVQNTPTILYSSIYDSDNISHAFVVNGVPIWSGYATGKNAIGGFHVVVLNRTTLALVDNEWYPSDITSTGAAAAAALISSYSSSINNLILVATFGNTSHIGASDDPDSTDQYQQAVENWHAFSLAAASIGGTQQVASLVNFSQYPPVIPEAPGDYNLIGFPTDTNFTGLDQVHGAEMSTVISVETEGNGTSNLGIEGTLKLDHQGFYSPATIGHASGMLSQELVDVLNASRLNPTPWPMPGDTNPQAAYAWISSQLCCADIRGAYLNQNVSPNVWFTQLQGLTYPSSVNFSQSDFALMKDQLDLEIQYLISVRLLQHNLLQLYQEQESTVPLLLTQAQNQVVNNLNIDLNTPAHSASWVNILKDSFGIIGTVAGFVPPETTGGVPIGPAIRLTMSFAVLGTDVAADETNTPAGTSRKAVENALTTAGQIASDAATHFTANLVQLGNHFDRISSDWGRLRAVGGPLVSGQLAWDSTAVGPLLDSFRRSSLREIYTKLLQANGQVNYYPLTSENGQLWATKSGGDTCHYSEYNVNAFYELPYGPNSSSTPSQVPFVFYPQGPLYDGFRYGWSVWALVFTKNAGKACPVSDTQPSTFGLFNAITPSNPDNLGTYRLWWFTRSGFNINTVSDIEYCDTIQCFSKPEANFRERVRHNLKTN